MCCWVADDRVTVQWQSSWGSTDRELLLAFVPPLGSTGKLGQFSPRCSWLVCVMLPFPIHSIPWNAQSSESLDCMTIRVTSHLCLPSTELFPRQGTSNFETGTVLGKPGQVDHLLISRHVWLVCGKMCCIKKCAQRNREKLHRTLLWRSLSMVQCSST